MDDQSLDMVCSMSYKKIDENEKWPCIHVGQKLDIVLAFGRDRGNTNMTNR